MGSSDSRVGVKQQLCRAFGVPGVISQFDHDRASLHQAIANRYQRPDMRFIWTTAVAVAIVASCASAANPRFCTQDEKNLVNKLHEQNADPAKSCYRAANGDITTVVTSRLCPLPECATWLAYMAANAPDCYYDSKNYATVYAKKNADCTGESSSSTSGSTSSSASLRSSSSGSEGSAAMTNSTASSSNATSSLSAASEDRDMNTTESLSSSQNGSAVGDVSSVDGSDSTGSASMSDEVEADATTAPTPTPTEDLTIEDSPASGTTDSSNSSTPAPTTSGSSSSTSLSSLVTLVVLVAASAVVGH